MTGTPSGVQDGPHIWGEEALFQVQSPCGVGVVTDNSGVPGNRCGVCGAEVGPESPGPRMGLAHHVRGVLLGL